MPKRVTTQQLDLLASDMQATAAKSALPAVAALAAEIEPLARQLAVALAAYNRALP